MTRAIGFVSYETKFAPWGGISAVIDRLPGRIQEASGLDTVVITPFHHRIMDRALLQMRVGQVIVPFDGAEISVTVHRRDDRWPWFFLEPVDSLVFAAWGHPYNLAPTVLLRDSLVFGAAVHQALGVIRPETEWTLMLQDWEAATAALAVISAGNRHETFLTLHNSYDSGELTDGELRRVGIDPDTCPGPKGRWNPTVLERTLDRTVGPVFTVSDQFALDLTSDTYQTRVMAPHLQDLLDGRVRGVDNGPFLNLAVNDDLLTEAARGNWQPLNRWKQERRMGALRALDETVTSGKPQEEVWGNLERFDPSEEACWFVMAGRDDPRQKGYDVAAAAAEVFLGRRDDARFVFMPRPGDEGLEGLTFLRTLAERFSHAVIVVPFQWPSGFAAMLQGATWGLMPSLYEPFGMANEFYLNGTPVIGRATGGIVEQIVPLRAAGACSRAVAVYAKTWHSASSEPTGILYRERDSLESAVEEDWNGINRAQYWPRDESQSQNRVCERQRYPLFRAMVNELGIGLTDGIEVYQRHPGLYYRMLTHGIGHVQRSFSWSRAGAEYLRSVR